MMHAESGSEAVVTCLLEAHAFIDAQDKVNNIIILFIPHIQMSSLLLYINYIILYELQQKNY